MVQKLSPLNITTLPIGYHYDSTLPAFGVYVGKRVKTFIVVRNGRRTLLGKYPSLTLAEARRKAHRILGDKSKHVTAPSTSDALETYLSTIKVRPKTLEEYDRLLKSSPLPSKLSAITPTTVLNASNTGSRAGQRHLFFAMSAFLTWCADRQYIERNPLKGVRCPHPQTSRERFLDNDELVAVWNAADPKTTYGAIVRLLILTGQRRSQIACLQEVWVNEDTITFPAHIMKGKRSHTIPLTEAMKPYIANYSFTGWSKRKRSLDDDAVVYDWTLHDLRRTYSTLHAQIGTPPHVTEAILDHRTGTRSTIQRTYDRHNYLPQMRDAQANYERYLFDLIQDKAT